LKWIGIPRITHSFLIHITIILYHETILKLCADYVLLYWPRRRPSSFLCNALFCDPCCGSLGDLIQQLIKHLEANQPTNQPTSQPTKDLSQGASGRPSVCIAIPALNASLGSITDTYNYNRDRAYANDFPSRLKTPT